MKKNLFSTALLLGASILTFGQSNTFPPSGNVGIGTSSPTERLDVQNGNIRWGNSYLTSDQGGSLILRSEAIDKTQYINFFNPFNSFSSTFMINNKRKSLGFSGAILEFEKGIQFINSEWGKGFIIKMEPNDQGDGQTGLNITAKHGDNDTWESALFIKASTKGNNAYVGIGTKNPNERLTVKGKIHAEEVIVDLNVPADYVFQKYYTGKSDLKTDYVFPKLNEIETFVKENNHLPDMPSAKEIQENGLKIGEMNNLLLQKIEELTLYIIQQEKEINKMKQDIKLLKNE